MKVLHVIHALQRASGASVFCVETCRRLAGRGDEVRIACQGGVEYPTGALAVQRVRRPREISFTPDIVHIHGLWDPFLHQAMACCRERGYPYVLSTHGCLMRPALRRGALKKWLALRLYLRRDLALARRLYATTPFEERAIRGLRLGVATVVIPLGVDLPSQAATAPASGAPDRPRVVLFVSRLSPEKGLLELLRAWKTLHVSPPGGRWRLVLAGPDCKGYQRMLARVIDRERIDGVEFTGSVYDEAKERLYRSADVFVLPSRTENFSAVVTEALAYGLPVVTTQGTPWEVLEREGCGKWVPFGVGTLGAALREMMTMDATARAEMGRRGQQLVRERYDWTVVARALQASYEVVLSRQPDRDDSGTARPGACDGTARVHPA